MNKKFLIYILIAIIFGLVLGNIFYQHYETEQNIDRVYNSYLIQLGIYEEDELKDKINDIENYLIIEKNNKYYVYLGISTKKENAKKIKTMYSNNNIDVSIKKSVISDIEFISSLEQYDILMENAVTNEDIMAINEVVLSSYEEMVLND